MSRSMKLLSVCLALVVGAFVYALSRSSSAPLGAALVFSVVAAGAALLFAVRNFQVFVLEGVYGNRLRESIKEDRPDEKSPTSKIVRFAEIQLMAAMELATKRSRLLMWAGFGVVVLGLAVAGIGIYDYKKHEQRTDLLYPLLIVAAYMQLIALRAWRMYSEANEDVHAYAARMIYCRQLMVVTTLADTGSADAKEKTRGALLRQLLSLARIALSPRGGAKPSWTAKLKAKKGDLGASAEAGS